LSETTKVFCK